MSEKKLCTWKWFNYCRIERMRVIGYDSKLNQLQFRGYFWSNRNEYPGNRGEWVRGQRHGFLPTTQWAAKFLDELDPMLAHLCFTHAANKTFPCSEERARITYRGFNKLDRMTGLDAIKILEYFEADAAQVETYLINKVSNALTMT